MDDCAIGEEKGGGKGGSGGIGRMEVVELKFSACNFEPEEGIFHGYLESMVGWEAVKAATELLPTEGAFSVCCKMQNSLSQK